MTDRASQHQVGRGRHGAWMQTYTGRRFWPLDPRSREIEIADIAHGLAMTCRYGGHARRFYSVAEHAVLVSQFVPPEYARHGLLHDSAEAYVGDMVRPLKHQPEMDPFRLAEARIEVEVSRRFGLRWTPEALEAVKRVDDRILVDEIRVLMKRPKLYTGGALRYKRRLGAQVLGLPPDAAEQVFIARFRQLFPSWGAGRR